jgi:O-antigen ligase
VLKFARYTAFAGAILIIIGLFWSRALQSIGCGLVFLHPFLNGSVRSTWWALKRSTQGLLLTLYYSLVVISYFWTSNINAWADQNMILKLPMILLPFGFLAPNALDRKRITWLLYFFIFMTWLTGAISFINYLLNYAEINASIVHSKPIPIICGIKDGAYHIYYSLMLGFAALTGLYLLWRQGPRRIRAPIFFFTFCNIVFLHVIAARTGLVGFYAALFAGLVYIAIAKRKMVTGLIGIGILAAAMVITFTLVPTMRNRLDNTVTDLDRYRTNKDINHYSISMRLEALKTAWAVFKQSPIIGVGPGDVRGEMSAQYTKDNSPLLPQNRHLPHNQFVETLVMLGITGGIILILIFFLPAHYRDIEWRMLFTLFMVLCFVSFQFESFMERQVGLTFFVLFYMVLGGKHERR